MHIMCCMLLCKRYGNHTVKENGVNMPELLQSVYISKNVLNFVVLNAKSLVPFNLLIYNFYKELLNE